MQTLKEKKENKDKILSELRKMKNNIFNKNSEINKNDDSIPSISQVSKEHLMSSKFQRPSKFLFNSNISTTNSNNNQSNINRENSRTKINSLFDSSKFPNYKEKKGIIQSCFNNKDKDKEKTRLSMRRPKNKTISNKKEDKINLEKKLSNKDEVINNNFLSEFNKKPKKKLFESPVKKNDYYPNMNKKLKLNF